MCVYTDMLLLLLLLLLLPRSAEAQTCVVNSATCTSGSSTWWSGCSTATIGGASIALAPSGGPLSFVGVPINNMLVAEKRTAVAGTGASLLLQSWTTTLQAGPTGPMIIGVNADTIWIRNAGYYEINVQVGTWSTLADVDTFTFTVAELVTSRTICHPHTSLGQTTSASPRVASLTCFAVAATADLYWRVYATSDTQICGMPNVEHVCTLFVRQLPVVPL